MEPTQQDIDEILDAAASIALPPAGWQPTEDGRGAVQLMGWRVTMARPTDPVFVIHAPPGEELGPEVSVSVSVFAFVAALNSLDGTAPPSEQETPGAEKGTG